LSNFWFYSLHYWKVSILRRLKILITVIDMILYVEQRIFYGKFRNIPTLIVLRWRWNWGFRVVNYRVRVVILSVKRMWPGGSIEDIMGLLLSPYFIITCGLFWVNFLNVEFKIISIVLVILFFKFIKRVCPIDFCC